MNVLSLAMVGLPFRPRFPFALLPPPHFWYSKKKSPFSLVHEKGAFLLIGTPRVKGRFSISHYFRKFVSCHPYLFRKRVQADHNKAPLSKLALLFQPCLFWGPERGVWNRIKSMIVEIGFTSSGIGSSQKNELECILVDHQFHCFAGPPLFCLEIRGRD